MPKEPEQQTEQEQFAKLRMPNRNEREMFALTLQLMGATQIKALCEDGKERMCRIPGKLRKRVWIKQNDILIIQLWEWQPDRADIVWRFWGTQAEHLKRRGLLKNLPV
jgi:translation initiation factor 1A